jgi:hypothetical protein
MLTLRVIYRDGDSDVQKSAGADAATLIPELLAWVFSR